MNEGRDVALALLAGFDGSAPVATGAYALVDADGELTGDLTGGAIEAAVADLARQMLAGGGDADVHAYEISDDQAQRSGLSCGGVAHVLIAPVTDTSAVRARRAGAARSPAACAGASPRRRWLDVHRRGHRGRRRGHDDRARAAREGPQRRGARERRPRRGARARAADVRARGDRHRDRGGRGRAAARVRGDGRRAAAGSRRRSTALPGRSPERTRPRSSRRTRSTRATRSWSSRTTSRSTCPR